MTLQKLCFAVLLTLFALATASALRDFGYLGFFDQVFANSATQLAFFDLMICLGLLGAWMVVDGRRRGRVTWPFLLLTLIFGVAGPLLYLVLEPKGPRPS